MENEVDEVIHGSKAGTSAEGLKGMSMIGIVLAGFPRSASLTAVTGKDLDMTPRLEQSPFKPLSICSRDGLSPPRDGHLG